MLADIPSDVLALCFVIAIMVCAAAGMAWGIFFTPTAAELLEQQAERDAAADGDTANILTEFRNSQPAALEMLHAPLAGDDQHRRSCEQLGLCGAQPACSACPQRQPLSHPLPARAEHA
jgi:hypothetical protein